MFLYNEAPAGRHRAFVPSILLHCFVALLLTVTWQTAPIFRQRVQSLGVKLVSPAPTATRHVRARLKPEAVRMPATRPLLLPPRRIEKPTVLAPIPVAAETPKPVPDKIPALALPGLAVAAPPKSPVRTEVFAATAPAPPVHIRPAPTPETGAFQPVVSNSPAVPRDRTAATGSFGSAEGRGAVSAVNEPAIRATGFGDAKPGKSAAGEPRSVGVAVGFGNAVIEERPGEFKRLAKTDGFEAVSLQAPRSRREVESARSSDVEILSKPRPAYTEQAKKLRIEGEVLIQVVFAASGEVRVGRVVKSLGHGLDEAALLAAANIRFKPAERNGLPVDSTAIARITFSLAY